MGRRERETTEERDTGLERRTIRSRRRGRIVRARFFLFREGCERQEEKSTLLQPAPQKSLEKVSLSLSLSVRSSPSLSGTCQHRFFLFYKQGGKCSNHCVNTKEDRKKRKTPPTLFNLKKNSVVSPFHLRGFFLSLRVWGGGGERVLKVKSLFTSSPARPPCSRPTRPSRPSSWRSTPSASRAPP